jgi:hypothetical protein
MKTLLSLVSTLIIALSLGAPCSAHDHSHGKHAHEHGSSQEPRKSGPNGGRMLSFTPAAEFLVTKDRHVQLTFLDAAGVTIAPAEQIVTVTTGQRPTTLTFVRQGNVLVSTTPITGDKQPAVVLLKSSPTAKAAVARFTLDLSECPGCGLLEYACSCSHAIERH